MSSLPLSLKDPHLLKFGNGLRGVQINGFTNGGEDMDEVAIEELSVCLKCQKGQEEMWRSHSYLGRALAMRWGKR